MIVGLIGKKRSGKDTYASTLVLERGFTRFAFADPLKRAALRIDPVLMINGYSIRLGSIVDRVGWEDAKEVSQVRQFLQDFGVSMREEVAEDLWVRATMDAVARNHGDSVITDVRFPNEADAIKRAGGVLVRIERTSLESDDDHISENAMNDYESDWTVLNDGTLDDLAHSARWLNF